MSNPVINIKYDFKSFDEPTTSTVGLPYAFYFDWKKAFSGIAVTNPQQARYSINPGATKTIFSGSVTTGIDGTTTFSLAKNTSLSSIYRLSRTAGTSPAFKSDRALALDTFSITITNNNDGTVTFSTSGGSLAALSAGDTLFIPGLTTGDAAGPFNAQNEGEWQVLTTGLTSVVLGRVGGAFSGYTETVTVTSNTQVLGFSAAGVQIGSTLDIVSGFSATAFGTYEITQVTPDWIEIRSASALPAQTGVVPTATGLVVYDSLKSWIHVEADQSCVVRFNGDATDGNRITPMVLGGASVGYLQKLGAVYSMVVINKSATSQLNLLVFTAE